MPYGPMKLHQKLASTCKLKFFFFKKLIEISDLEDFSIKDEHIKSVRSTAHINQSKNLIPFSLEYDSKKLEKAVQ